MVLKNTQGLNTQEVEWIPYSDKVYPWCKNYINPYHPRKTNSKHHHYPKVSLTHSLTVPLLFTLQWKSTAPITKIYNYHPMDLLQPSVLDFQEVYYIPKSDNVDPWRKTFGKPYQARQKWLWRHLDFHYPFRLDLLTYPLHNNPEVLFKWVSHQNDWTQLVLWYLIATFLSTVNSILNICTSSLAWILQKMTITWFG